MCRLFVLFPTNSFIKAGQKHSGKVFFVRVWPIHQNWNILWRASSNETCQLACLPPQQLVLWLAEEPALFQASGSSASRVLLSFWHPRAPGTEAVLLAECPRVGDHRLCPRIHWRFISYLQKTSKFWSFVPNLNKTVLKYQNPSWSRVASLHPVLYLISKSNRWFVLLKINKQCWRLQQFAAAIHVK